MSIRNCAECAFLQRHLDNPRNGVCHLKHVTMKPLYHKDDEDKASVIAVQCPGALPRVENVERLKGSCENCGYNAWQYGPDGVLSCLACKGVKLARREEPRPVKPRTVKPRPAGLDAFGDLK